MQKRYGGIKSTQNLEEIEEATVYIDPPVRLTNGQIAGALAIGMLRLFPKVAITMLILGAIALAIHA